MKILRLLRLKARWRRYLAHRKLAKSGYLTWRSYRHNRDPDVVRHADKVSDFYSKYNYVYRCDGHNHYAYQCIGDYGPGGLRFGYEDMRDWCELKCRFKYRMDINRVYRQTGLDINGDTHEDWWFNDIGGSDFVFFAFMNEQDYIMFKLRWS
jgi:hypothetical protein